MMKCWIIEQGNYSSYSVVGIFSTEENANRAMATLNGSYDEPSVTEREFDPGVAELNEGLHHYLVRFADGLVKTDLGNFIECEDWHWVGGSIYSVWAKNDQAAIKIAAERHAQYQAQAAGIT